MGQPRILVVDDEDTIRHVLRRIFNMHDCEIREAGSAEDALTLVAEWKPEVALLDIVLPGKNGIQLLGEVKQLSRDTEVVMMTSSSSAETALAAMRKGAYDYIQKPLDLKEVWTTVQRAMEKRALSLKNRDLLKRHEQRNRELSSVVATFDSSQEASGDHSLSEILDHFLGVVTDELEADKAAVLLLGERSGELRVVASRGIEGVDRDQVRIRPGEGVVGSVAERGEPFLAAGSDGAGVSPEVDPFLATPIALGVPIKREQDVLGVIAVTHRRSGEPFVQGDVAYLAGMAGQLAVAIDVAKHSEQLQTAYETLKATQDQLVFSERIKAIGQMAAGVAHDFNNALSVILARAQCCIMKLDRDEPDVRKVRADLKTIIKTSLQGAEMIKRIQDYTRIRKDMPKAPVDLNAVITDAVEIARPKWKEESEAQGRRIEIGFELAEVPRVSGNVHELTQVVGNFIFNAVEAMPEGGTITFRTTADSECVVFEVEDTGTGMDEETTEHLFDPFFTTKETGQGLGTAIIYGIVTRHGGEIAVDSEPGRGTRFSVKFPRATEFQEAESSADDDAQEFIPTRVLLVDDDQMVLETFEEALVASGHQVVAASEGKQALALMERSEVDLVVTDLSMENMNGLELARKIKARNASLPVILLSGWAVQQQAEQVAEAGVDHVLLKPCLIEDLLRTINKAIRAPAGT